MIVGDRCKLTDEGCRYYGGIPGKWVPSNQGGVDGVGTIAAFGDRPFKLGASPRPYVVKWDNGEMNTYREEDLVKFDGAEG